MVPSSSDLLYFVEVSSSLNLSRASERLGISQPSLSLAIQRLEHAIGTSLLIRSKKGVSLTQPGKQLLAHSKDLLQKWEDIKTKSLESHLKIQGSYTLGCHPSVALYSLPHFLPSLLEDYPKLEIKLRHDLSRKITESIIRMETDLGIVVNPVKHSDLVIKQLCTDEVTFWISEGSRKTQNFNSGGAVLICDPELVQTQDLLKKLTQCGINYSRVLTSSNLEVITSLVASGAGIGIIPGRVATSRGAGALKKIPGAPVFQDEICLLYRVESRSVRTVQTIVDRVVSALACQ